MGQGGLWGSVAVEFADCSVGVFDDEEATAHFVDFSAVDVIDGFNPTAAVVDNFVDRRQVGQLELEVSVLVDIVHVVWRAGLIYAEPFGREGNNRFGQTSCNFRAGVAENRSNDHRTVAKFETYGCLEHMHLIGV